MHRHRHADQLADRRGALLGLVDDRRRCARPRAPARSPRARTPARAARPAPCRARRRCRRTGPARTRSGRPRRAGRCPSANGLRRARSRAAGALIAFTVRSIAARRSRLAQRARRRRRRRRSRCRPTRPGSASSSRSIARCDSVPGVLKSSTNEPPAEPGASAERGEHHRRRSRVSASSVLPPRRPWCRGVEPWVAGKAQSSAILQPMHICDVCIRARPACSLRWAHAGGAAGTQEAAHARADRRGGDAPLRRARLPGDDDRRHRARPPTSRRARSSRTSRRRRPWSSTTSTATSTAWRARCASACPARPRSTRSGAGSTRSSTTGRPTEDDALLRKRLCREDEGLANFEGGHDGPRPGAAARGDRQRISTSRRARSARGSSRPPRWRR